MGIIYRPRCTAVQQSKRKVSLPANLASDAWPSLATTHPSHPFVRELKKKSGIKPATQITSLSLCVWSVPSVCLKLKSWLHSWLLQKVLYFLQIKSAAVWTSWLRNLKSCIGHSRMSFGGSNSDLLSFWSVTYLLVMGRKCIFSRFPNNESVFAS